MTTTSAPTFGTTIPISEAMPNLSRRAWRKPVKNFLIRRLTCNASLSQTISSQFTLESDTRPTRLKSPSCTFFVLRVTALLKCGISGKKHQRTRPTRTGCSKRICQKPDRQGGLVSRKLPLLTRGLLTLHHLYQVIVLCSLAQNQYLTIDKIRS